MIKIRKISEYLEENETYCINRTMECITKAFADKVDLLEVTQYQLLGIALCFNVKSNWNIEVWGMKLKVIKD